MRLIGLKVLMGFMLVAIVNAGAITVRSESDQIYVCDGGTCSFGSASYSIRHDNELTYVCKGHDCSFGSASFSIRHDNELTYVCKGHDCSFGSAGLNTSDLSLGEFVSVLTAAGIVSRGNNSAGFRDNSAGFRDNSAEEYISPEERKRRAEQERIKREMEAARIEVEFTMNVCKQSKMAPPVYKKLLKKARASSTPLNLTELGYDVIAIYKELELTSTLQFNFAAGKLLECASVDDPEGEYLPTILAYRLSKKDREILQKHTEALRKEREREREREKFEKKCKLIGENSDDIECRAIYNKRSVEEQRAVEEKARKKAIAAFKKKYDPDNDGYCVNTYSANESMVESLCKGEDDCPDVKGTAPDGCDEESRRALYLERLNRAIESFTQTYDGDRDGFCEQSFGTDYKYYLNDEKAYVREAIKTVCYHSAYDKCPREKGVEPNGCSAAYNQRQQEYAEESARGKKRNNDRYLRDQAFKKFGHPDSDGDKVCAPWVSTEGYEQVFADMCTGYDECPNEFAKTRNGCRGRR